jgi:hypothetical protein
MERSSRSAPSIQALFDRRIVLQKGVPPRCAWKGCNRGGLYQYADALFCRAHYFELRRTYGVREGDAKQQSGSVAAREDDEHRGRR